MPITHPGAWKLAVAVLVLTVCCSSNDQSGTQAGSGGANGEGGSGGDLACFPCTGYWICGGDVTRIDLTPEPDGCYLSGLPGRKLIGPDGTITEAAAIVGKAAGTGARVTVSYPDGSQWLFCAGGGGCLPPHQ